MFAQMFHILNFIPGGIWLFLGTCFLGWAGWKLWTHYIQRDFISGIEFVMLEIVPPREVMRSPRAMELFFTNALYHFTTKDTRATYWTGAVRFWFSLEIVSLEGQVHFYIRMPSRVKELIETQIYAQYPQAQVKVAEDYTLAVDKITADSDWNLSGWEYKLEKPDAYPIKTYVDFGLDADPKEEYKIDPISPVIELFGALGKGEQYWLQIVVTPSKKTYNHDGKKVNWVEEGHIILEKLAEPYTKINERPGGGPVSREMRLPPWLEPVVEGINKKTLKLGFDTGIRFCYVAKKESFNKNTKRQGRLIFHQYSNPYMNQFARTNSSDLGSLFGNVSPKTQFASADKMLNHYRERLFFYLPIEDLLTSRHHPHTFVLNTEELATIYHFPGQILKVPTLERIESKEASPPTNLPT